ncbi:hypothetical protein QNH46_04465 [Paenibacillus woosongensis]|uniref:Uncharacterized protein n=1 Tax=Paenibacillus woosongensis TaxID=307580 RepID=A0AA95I8J7_9BACL|nr:hypothetical protein [Paenibacillus woosongensis]WHX49927.1 hypothetical protein QNH46_04465 [Paenibacillus woosongensis]
MPTIRRLITEHDLQMALEQGLRIRVFRDNHLIESGSIIIRLTEDTVITQSSVSDLAYHNRSSCQFFELKK